MLLEKRRKELLDKARKIKDVKYSKDEVRIKWYEYEEMHLLTALIDI